MSFMATIKEYILSANLVKDINLLVEAGLQGTWGPLERASINYFILLKLVTSKRHVKSQVTSLT
jgi:hypothetical protein